MVIKHNQYYKEYLSPLSITIALIFNYLTTGRLECSKEKVASYDVALRIILTPERLRMLKRRKKIIRITVRTLYYEELSKDVYEYDEVNKCYRLKNPNNNGEYDLERIWKLHLNKIWRKCISIQPEAFILASVSQKPLVALLGDKVAERGKKTITKFVLDNTPKINPISIMLALTIQYLAFGEFSCTNEQINRYAIEINNALSNKKNDFQFIFPSVEYDEEINFVYYRDEEINCYTLRQPYCLGEEWLEKLCEKYFSNLPIDFIETATSMDALIALFGTRICEAIDNIDSITKFITNNTKVKEYVRAKIKVEKKQPKVGE